MHGLLQWSQPVTVDDLLSDLASRGWQVNNLYQLDSDVWVANLRNETHITDFGRAMSPALALTYAIANIEAAEPRQEISPAAAVAGTSLAEILAHFLPKPQPTRR